MHARGDGRIGRSTRSPLIAACQVVSIMTSLVGDCSRREIGSLQFVENRIAGEQANLIVSWETDF